MTEQLTIRHRFFAGTTVENVELDSAAHRALTNHRSWVWARGRRTWFLRASQRQLPKYDQITEIAKILADLGYQVTHDVDETRPSIQEREADLARHKSRRAAQLRRRVTTLSARIAHLRAEADKCFPDNEQPVLEDHYSAPADKRRRERGWQLRREADELAAEADKLTVQATEAEHYIGARYTPAAIGDRVKALTASARALQDELTGTPTWETHTDENGQPRDRLVRRAPDEPRAAEIRRDLDHLAEDLAYWQNELRTRQAEQHAIIPGPDTVHEGDWIAIGSLWARVRQVNTRSVTVPHPTTAPGPHEKERRGTVPWHKITDLRSAEAMRALDPDFVERYETAGTNRRTLAPRDADPA
ncbi:hypothetical protein [Amycolatopsis sp. NPDC058986]|uniref:hypothetical protein n=1 Tax=unclassified Amycolatopsis TaxID=2618356 RepID=UPI0036729E7D